MLVVPTRGSEAAQCEQWQGHKNRLAKVQLLLQETNPFMSKVFVVVVQEEEVLFVFSSFEQLKQTGNKGEKRVLHATKATRMPQDLI